MDDDLTLDLETSDRANERIRVLNSKAKDAETAAEAAKAQAATADAARIAAEKERDFYSSFTDSATKYPGSTEYKDKIKEKVMAGYSVEDATVSVLNAEGKLPSPKIEVAPPVPAAGGSALNQLPEYGNKSIGEMSREEKRAALIDAEKRGDIALS